MQWETLELQDHDYSAKGFLKPSVVLTMSHSSILFYTGVSKDVFQSLAEAVAIMTTTRSRLPLQDQLLQTLMRLRLGLLNGDLAIRFGISVTAVFTIFHKMLNMLKKIMEYVVFWLPRESIKNSMPTSFVESGYSDTTCILDCTEIILKGQESSWLGHQRSVLTKQITL